MCSKPVETRQCLYFNVCKRREVYNGIKWQQRWFNYKNGKICNIHYHRIITRPKLTPEVTKRYRVKRTKEYIKKINQICDRRRLSYINKIRYVGFDIRKGYCSWCPNNIYNGSCKKTAMHHIEYYPIFVWFATIEICVSCHNKESARLRRKLKSEKRKPQSIN